MDTTLETPLLRTLVAVSETGSFTRAAAQVHRTQSAVSMQIKRLEQTVGKPLLERDRRHARLTREGEALVEYARRILNLHEEALAAVSEPEITGRVRIGTPDDYAAGFLPQVLSDFAETHPNVEVDMRCETSAKIFRAFEQGEVDVALLTSGPWLKGGEIIRREPIVWATSVRHMVHERDPLPLAVFEPGCLFRESALAAFDKSRRPYRIAYSSESTTGLVTAALAGLAVTVLARSSVPAGLRELSPDEGFPVLRSVDIALLRPPPGRSRVADRLADHIAQRVPMGAAKAA
ncbi:MAG: LysR substrate-binding domain-containing protein [Alphaproteobacteria bacterium]|nr:LysR substrate-binding domain-containing protein [Alphaproteobacteria bacterium]MCZ6592297.1 LysR substrate-binding domain-containing protein [Alphaproteobacteria bacterium]